MDGKRVLIVLTNFNKISGETQQYNLSRPAPPPPEGGLKSGFDIREVANLWEALGRHHSLPIDFATPQGGEAHIDPTILKQSEHEQAVQALLKNRSVLNTFKDTLKAEELNPLAYSWVFFVGAAAVLMDFPNSPRLAQFISQIHENGAWIGAIGHGTCALLNVKNEKNGDWFVKGKRITFATKKEDEKAAIDRNLPFSLEDQMKEREAKILNKDAFAINVVVDEAACLITAQNTQSSREFVEKVLQTGHF